MHEISFGFVDNLFLLLEQIYLESFGLCSEWVNMKLRRGEDAS